MKNVVEEGSRHHPRRSQGAEGSRTPSPCSRLVGCRHPGCFPGWVLERFWLHFGPPFGALLGTIWELKLKKFFYRFWSRFGCPFGCLLGSKIARFGSPGGHSRRKGDTWKKLVLLKENHVFSGSGGPGAHPN